MDPLTQGLLGGCAAQAVLGRRTDLPLSAAGVFGAMAPDLDVLIGSSQDPVLSWEMHRSFTHSLLFIPIGGLLIASLLWIFYRRHYSFAWIFSASTVGYATHWLLDALTSYGTLLFWPFSRARVSWDVLSVIDPVVTVLLLLGFLLSLWRHSRRPAILALTVLACYGGLGYFQNQRGLQIQRQLAEFRGHPLDRGRVMPTLGNIILWRSVYESSGRFYVDEIRLPFWQNPHYWEAGSVEKFNMENPPKKIPTDSTLANQLQRFNWFADGMLFWSDKEMGVIGDLRYGRGTQAFWGVRAHFASPEKGIRKVRFRFPVKESLQEHWQKIRGIFPEAQAVPQAKTLPLSGPLLPNPG